MTTAWIDAMKLPECDQRLAQLVRIAPVPMPKLDQLAPEDAGKALHLALKGFYSPSAQDLALVREIASVGRSHAHTYYRSDEQFIAWASSKPQFQPSPDVRMLTGPSGVGKSELLKAVRRLFSRTQFTQPSSNLPPFPIYPVNLDPNSDWDNQCVNLFRAFGGDRADARFGEALSG